MVATGLKGFNLSIQQAHLWSLQDTSSQTYCAQCALHIAGQLDRETLLQAVQGLVERHSILRTAFFRMPGMDVPVQIINKHVAIELELIDLEHLSPKMRELQWQDELRIMQHEGVDLTNGPLLAMKLYRLASDAHILLISLPSMCADDRTLSLLVTELSQAYALQLRGALSTEDAEDALQYVDVAAWQDELLLEEDAELNRHYWQKIDLTHVATMPLPAKRRTNEVSVGASIAAFNPLVQDISVDETLLTQIKKRADQYHVSLADYLLTCWYSTCLKIATTNIVMGTACDGRGNEELQDALGLYKRFVPISMNIDDDIPFEQFLLLMQANLAEAYEKQIHFSWDDSTSRTNSTALASHFPISFEYDSWPASLQAGELTFSLLKSWSCMEPFVLKLSARQIGERLQLAFHYDPQQIAGEQVKYLSGLFCTLLKNATEQPQVQIGALSLLSKTEHTHLLTTFSALPRSWPAQGLHQLFEAQVKRTPDLPAVVGLQEQLTYQQLNQRANQLAEVLRQRGVGPSMLVGVCLPRQAHMLVAVLGILKAGAAYLPLDMSSPALRLSYQLHKSRATLLLTQQDLRASLPTWEGETVYLEDLETELVHASPENGHTEVRGDDLAYVIFTSGSTGMPKGVMVRQSSVVNYTQALCEQLGARPGWQYATVSTLAADLGNTAIFCALASGGCVQVLPYETVTSGEAMANWAEQHPIDVLKIVPSHLSALLEGQHEQRWLPRRALVLGGEALSAHLVKQVRQVGATCHIYNHYGPTETTIGVLVNALGAGEHVDENAIPTLGRPIANTQVYVLDRHLQLVPQGVIGELYLGGAGVARGYLQQPEQTAERFVPHPYSEIGGERLYRTGDLVRYGWGEQIEFVGRRDGQVKLRGYRIEMGEIEAALLQHPQIRDCVVMLRQDTMSEPRLVGYVVSKQQVSIPREQLEEWLRLRVPEYMLPTEYVQIAELPLTANGKVDRERLPLPEQRVVSEANEIVQPRSPLEEMVAQLWRDLLGIAVVGVYDNFFAVGGHSLLATRLVARLQAMLQITLPVQLLFESPTVAGFAQKIEHMLRQGETINMPPLIASVRPEEIPLSFAQQRLWFLDRLQPESTGYLSTRIQRFVGKLNTTALEQSLHELIKRHENLRTTFEDRAGQAVQIIHPIAPFTLPVIDLQGLAPELREQEARTLARQEAQRPCHLALGPLFRASLLRLATQEHMVLLTLHHIITDGWSMMILARELTTLYDAFINGRPSPLSPLPIQYVDYALWQRQWLQGETLEAQLAYWRTHLAGIEPLNLPTDHPRPAKQTYRGATQVQIVPAEILESLQQLSQQEGVTLFMLLLASFQVLLARYSGQQDISMGTPIANRTRAEIEGVVGFFVNTLVLRSDLTGDPTFQQFLAQVRTTCLQAYAHQDIPFEKIVEELEPERDLNRSPLFQVWFVLHETSPGLQELTGIRAEALSTEDSTSKFDLTLSLNQSPQGLHSVLEYSTDLFEAETIHRLLEHWQHLLVGIARHPQARLSDLPLLSQHEQEVLLAEWNPPTRTMPTEELCLHQLFEQQVLRTPDAVALVYEEHSVTYDALNRRANQLARSLRRLSIGPDALVGLYLERSIDMVIGIMGILKAGGAYVPLDISTPHERLALILEDIQAVAILTRTHLLASLPNEGDLPICLDTYWETLAQNNSANPAYNTSPSHLAYVIYTSGSTGKPKGVLVTHANAVHSTQARFTYYEEPVRNYLLLSPFFFDSSVAGLYWTLCQGGKLVLLREDFRTDLPRLPQFIMQQYISHMLGIPSLYAFILNEAQPQQLASLRTVVVAGETCPVSLLQRHREVVPQAALYNEYGPTEGSVWSSVYRYQFQELDTQVPIGRPITNVQIYVLDQALHLVPIGVPGELCIGGHGIVRGYLNHADLTAEKFIPHPYSQQPGERLYRTGDLARYSAEGDIEFLGRIDRQVKVRGYRIELKDIEATLLRHPSVFACTIVAREYASDDKRLVAYVVLHPEQKDAVENTSYVDALHTFLQEHLPEYMLPAHILILEQLPLTANGKIDQKQLPAPDWDGFASSKDVVAPRNSIEEKIVAIWTELLGLPDVSIHDNFFELGGNSLLATRVMYQISDAFHLDLPLLVLFETPTVATLAVTIVQQQAGEVDTELLNQLLAELDQTV